MDTTQTIIGSATARIIASHVTTNAGRYAMYESPVVLMTGIERALGPTIHAS